MVEYYDNLEISSVEERELSHFHNLPRILKEISAKASGWKNILDEVNINNIVDRASLQKIKVTRKNELNQIQKNNPPFGGLAIKNLNEFPYVFASPGPIYEPGDFGDFWGMSRALYSAGFRKNDLVYNTFSYHLGPAGIMMGNAAQNLGCTVIAGGIGNTDIQLQTIYNLKPNCYIGTPSFLKILLEKGLQNNLDTSCIKKALVGAEPLPPKLRQYFLNLNIDVMQMYGTAEIGCISYESKDGNKNLVPGMILAENIILEIVKPGTNEIVEEGDIGEVVITKLNSSYPMIRFGTGDMSAIIKCKSPCGRTNMRLKGWLGRADQSAKVRGLFVTPLQVDRLLKIYKEIYKARLVITNKNQTDKMTLFCETDNLSKEHQDKIYSEAKNILKLRLDINFVQKNNLKNDGIIIEDLRTFK